MLSCYFSSSLVPLLKRGLVSTQRVQRGMAFAQLPWIQCQNSLHVIVEQLEATYISWKRHAPGLVASKKKGKR